MDRGGGPRVTFSLSSPITTTLSRALSKTYIKEKKKKKSSQTDLKNTLTLQQPPAPLLSAPAPAARLPPGRAKHAAPPADKRSQEPRSRIPPRPAGLGAPAPGGDKVCCPLRAGRRAGRAPAPDKAAQARPGPGQERGAAPPPPRDMWRPLRGEQKEWKEQRSGIPPTPPERGSRGAAPAGLGRGGGRGSLPPSLSLSLSLPRTPGPSPGRGAPSRRGGSDAPRGPRRPRGTKERRGGGERRPGHLRPGGPAQARPRRAQLTAAAPGGGRALRELGRVGCDADAGAEVRALHGGRGGGGAGGRGLGVGGVGARARRAAPRGATATAPRAQQPS